MPPPPRLDCRNDRTSDANANSRGNLVRAKLLPPLLVGLPHDLCSWQVELSRSQEPEESRVVVSVVAESLGGSLSVGGDQARSEQVLPERLEGLLLSLVAGDQLMTGDCLYEPAGMVTHR